MTLPNRLPSTDEFINEGLNKAKSIVKGDKKAAELARTMVGDGQNPNKFFVTADNSYLYWDEKNKMNTSYDFSNPSSAPIKIEKVNVVETFGPYKSLAEAKLKAQGIDLDSKNGPRSVMIEDRLNGVVFERYLFAKASIDWNEEIYED